MDEPFKQMGEKLVSKALDNRVACWLGIESIRQLDKAGAKHDAEIVVAFTVQEEVGLRGAKTSSFAVRPDIGIGLDVTLACDTPGVPKQECVTVQGDGFALHIKDGSFISDHKLAAEIQKIAEGKNIKFQRSILAAGGQDGAAAQQAAAGAKAVGITVGTRYIHTVTEMCDKGDLEAARDILAEYLATSAKIGPSQPRPRPIKHAISRNQERGDLHTNLEGTDPARAVYNATRWICSAFENERPGALARHCHPLA